MKLNDLLDDILIYLDRACIEHKNIKNVYVCFPYLYWDLDRKQYYIQHDVVFDSNFDSFIIKLNNSIEKNHDLEDCFDCNFELHEEPLLVKLHTDSDYIIERTYYTTD